MKLDSNSSRRSRYLATGIALSSISWVVALSPTACGRDSNPDIDEWSYAVESNADGGSNGDGGTASEAPQGYTETCQLVAGITVCKMKYCEECPHCDADFDCDDYGFAFDEVCGDHGIPCWQAELDDDDAGHVINIIESQSPFDSVHDYYCAVEPQNNNVYGCWHQDGGEPSIPDWVMDQINDQWPDHDWELGDVWEDGHSDNAGEPCFIECPELVEEYETCTGYCAPTD